VGPACRPSTTPARRSHHPAEGPGDTTLRIIDQHGDLLTTVPRNSTGEISRFKAYGTRRRQ